MSFPRLFLYLNITEIINVYKINIPKFYFPLKDFKRS